MSYASDKINKCSSNIREYGMGMIYGGGEKSMAAEIML